MLSKLQIQVYMTSIIPILRYTVYLWSYVHQPTSMIFHDFSVSNGSWTYVGRPQVTAIIPDRGFRVGGTNVTIVTSAWYQL